MKKTIIALAISTGLLSCSSSQKTVSKKTEPALQPTAEQTAANKMQQSGVDFSGTGSTPVNWQLDINFDDTVHFAADDGLTLSFAFSRLKKDINAERSVYSAKINNADIVIVIEEKDCTVPTMREVFHKVVTFTFNSKAYTGCGKFLADNSLNNNWILEKIGNTAILPEEYSRVPMMQFDIQQQRVTGNDGCNGISGKAEVQGNRIKFSALASTRMACMKKSMESIISSKVSDKLVSYYFRDGKLFLYLEDDSLLVFLKG